MELEAQSWSNPIDVQLKFTVRIFNQNKNKAITIDEQRVKQRIQTVLYPLTVIDNKYELLWKFNENQAEIQEIFIENIEN